MLYQGQTECQWADTSLVSAKYFGDECSSWLRTVGRKKRDLREEKSHVTVTRKANEENTTGERGQGRSVCPPALTGTREPGTLFGKWRVERPWC